jgi:hypothetical protein
MRDMTAHCTLARNVGYTGEHHFSFGKRAATRAARFPNGNYTAWKRDTGHRHCRPFHTIVIGPEEKLSGDRIVAFCGFLLKEMRAHDFDQGRADAYSAWEKISQRPVGRFILSPDRAASVKPFEWTEDRKRHYEAELARFHERIRIVVKNALRGELPPIPIIERILSGVIASLTDIVIRRFDSAN